MMHVTFEDSVKAGARTKSTINEPCIILPIKPKNYHMCNGYKNWSNDFVDNILKMMMEKKANK